MEVSWEDADNFIRNAVTVKCGKGPWQAPPAWKLTRSPLLPIPIEDLQLDLRVDSDDDEETLKRIQRGACDFFERRTGYVVMPGSYRVELGGWWGGDLEVMRGPLRDPPTISYLAAANDWQPADAAGFYVDERPRSFVLRPLSTFDRPALWSEVGRVRIEFGAGFSTPDESDSDFPPVMEDGMRTILTIICGHYYENRELFAAGKLEELNLGALAFLGVYRQFW